MKVIKNNSDVHQLIREGLTFPRIAELNAEAIKEGYVTYSKESIRLSEKGIAKLHDLDIKFKKVNKDEWIEKDIKNMIPKLDKNVIFVPKQNELTF
ncbi:MAG: hypothetical protein IPG01_04175 [Chitinophagaceae bacterium]|nr:hypothetical protein [Chitinophagaceae bacterium]